MSEICMGDQVVDKVTGMGGTVTARCVYMHGPPRACVEPFVGNDGAYREPQWFDEARLDAAVGP